MKFVSNWLKRKILFISVCNVCYGGFFLVIFFSCKPFLFLEKKNRLKISQLKYSSLLKSLCFSQ